MNQSQLIEEISMRMGIDNDEATHFLSCFSSIIRDNIDQEIRIIGLGCFRSRLRSKRIGVNPMSRQPMEIPAKWVASFKASEKLKMAAIKNNN